MICQKSKVDDWYNHFKDNYGAFPNACNSCDLTKVKEKDLKEFLETSLRCDIWDSSAWIINYDLVWRRPELSKLTNFTLVLDESSLIQNATSKRSKFILSKLHPSNVILLSGTPVSGKYEQLWSQCKLLGWDISKRTFYNTYTIEEPIRTWNGQALKSPSGYTIKKIVGYKNVDRLKRKLAEYGAVFMKTEDVLDLPTQTFIDTRIATPMNYKKFRKNKIINIGDEILVGDSTLKKLLYSRMLCGHYCDAKLQAFEDLINSTSDRLVVFYNFNAELDVLKHICIKNGREHLSYINGHDKDISAFEQYDDTILFAQYQSGSYGHNLQLANKIVYFTPTLSSDMYEQSKKRVHRIGQNQPCFYYKLICGIEEDIYATLDQRKDYTDELFKKSFE